MKHVGRVVVIAVGIALGLSLFVGGCAGLVAYQEHRDNAAAAKAQSAREEQAAEQRMAEDAAAAKWREDMRRGAATVGKATAEQYRRASAIERAAERRDQEQARRDELQAQRDAQAP
jgi:hypothetical protein